VLRRLAVACALSCALIAPSGAQALAPTGLKAKLTREMRVVGARGSAYVLDLQTGQPLFQWRANTARPPASVEKLYTTSTALLRLGPDATFETKTLSTVPITPDGTLDGDLYLRGDGDPTLTTLRLDQLARQLAGMGITSVHGDVVGDGTIFDALRGSFRTGGAADGDMTGALGGLTVNRGYDGSRYAASPALVAARRFFRSLRRANVRVLGRAAAGPTAEGASELAGTTSVPLSQLVALTNAPSDNFYAETLLKTLGARVGSAGTTSAGAAVVRDQLAAFGVHPRVADGSGLARANRTTPRQVVRLLDRMDGQQIATTFKSSLAVPGRTGTLRRRMRGTAAAGRCEAKTGTLNGVSALAGYCPSQDGHTIAFAFLMSNVNVFTAHGVQDRGTAAIAGLTAR
jgi:D-alanyl-D-alanine carboxypeptidase/D-alanyl-D-alanine-endopeptidase (penicillin-binding protein 4)